MPFQYLVAFYGRGRSNSPMEKIEFKSLIFEKIWQVLLGLFCVSAFVSKSGISIFGILLILISVFILPWKEIAKNRKEVLIFIGLYPLAILCNLFSLGGVQSAVKVAVSWPWVLLALPGLVVFLRPRDQKVALLAAGLGFFLACLNAIYIFIVQFGGQFGSEVRVASFWDLGRWGVFVASSFLALLALYQYFQSKGNQRKYIFLGLSLLGLFCLFVSNTRAPWVAALLSCFVLCWLNPKLFRLLLFYVVLCVIAVFSSAGLRERIASIYNVEKSADGAYTSTDASNAGRLNMWKLAMVFYQRQPWFGTGFENTEKPLREFISTQDDEFRSRYITAEYSYRDQHSSYVSTLVQMGMLFSLIFWGVLLWLFTKHIIVWRGGSSLWASFVIALFFCHGVLFAFYTSSSSYEMLAFFPFVALFPGKSTPPT